MWQVTPHAGTIQYGVAYKLGRKWAWLPDSISGGAQKTDALSSLLFRSVVDTAVTLCFLWLTYLCLTDILILWTTSYMNKCNMATKIAARTLRRFDKGWCRILKF